MPRCDSLPRLEMWGGLEASVVRIGDDVVDQITLSGHDGRIEDLDAFAGLGIAAIRYPVLWERVAPGRLEDADWTWPDERLGRLRQLGVRPIVGLLHHGHGPRHTDLTAPDFAEKFAAYAARVAERYPWVDAYTPVNEPLTTARFCGLYGVWSPHARHPATFARILVNQIRATQLAMAAIRKINPAAQLIQTEDLGKAHSTPRMAHRAAFENQRRWLTFDLLTGRVTPEHPLWRWLAQCGVEAELREIAENPCPPDVIGIDHYLTSERFLDERAERYPEWARTANGRDEYADIEAIRVVAEGVRGPELLAADAWERYRLPIAFTEAHNACTREEQLRWLKDVWDGAVRLRQKGVDIRAVTAWALLGAFDWNSLMTRRVGFYESGVFDLRAGKPRPTALTRMVRELATAGEAEHPVLDAPGWWLRQDRFTYTPVRSCPYTIATHAWTARRERPRPLLITGGNGALARAVARVCVVRGLPYALLSRAELDIADADSVRAAFDRHGPWAVVNAAGFARVDHAEHEAARCWRDNVTGAGVLAQACRAGDVRLLGFSSAHVFDGCRREAYLESHAIGPLNVYGASLAAAEAVMLESCPDALIVRSGPMFSPWEDNSVVATTLRRIARGKVARAAQDLTVSPTYVPDLVTAALDLFLDDERGIVHLANAGSTTDADMIRALATRAGLDASLIAGVSGRDLWSAPRPRCSVLSSERALPMPSLDDALARYAGERWREPVLPAAPVFEEAVA